ncbi:glucosamine-6-phosphate deaminase [Halobacillus litoralis]|uniref:glucosamine-6-phosphate deaminase n=1 Tax=Halobacillus litoralis TaxID=45668 RepID=UPI001CFEFF9E|nr:glucosamine-6-phosphate deaminase [Halobacillus litoralis]
MNIIVVKDYKELSERACSIIENQIEMRAASVLGLATGSTPLGTYQELIQGYEEGRTDYSRVSTFNLDEYIGLSPDHPQSYRYFMNQKLFSHINISDENTYIPDGKAEDLQKECIRYERLVEEIGPPDLQLLGIGENGHIGFNEPGTSFESETHIVQLTDSTREANARFFSSMEDVPTQAVTMGIRSILKSRRILLLASGERKATAIKQFIESERTEQFPASSLKDHQDMTLIVDQAAYQKAIEKET